MKQWTHKKYNSAEDFVALFHVMVTLSGVNDGMQSPQASLQLLQGKIVLNESAR